MIFAAYFLKNYFLSFQQIFDDHYHFAHHSVAKRSIEPAHHNQKKLNDDDRVVWSKQQRAKSRQKRDYIRLKPARTFTASLLNDPKWQFQWYLVRNKIIQIAVEYN